MGVLRFKDDVDEILAKDPYDLFTAERKRVAKRPARGTVAAVAAGVALAAGVAAGVIAKSGAEPDDKSPYAYFEVKAIDPDGRPVAGAVVKEGTRAVGVTDSFGEWRRFMRVQPGATVMLGITKKSGTGLLSAVKSMAVPLQFPKDGDLELSGSVQLARGEDGAARAVAGAKAPKNGTEPAAAGDEPLGLASMRAAAEQRANGKGDDAPASAKANPPVDPVGAAFADADQRAAARTALRARNYEVVDDTDIPPAAARPAADADHPAGTFAIDALGVTVDGRPFAPLTDVVAQLKTRAKDLGVRLDAGTPFQLVVRDLVAAGDDGADAHLLQVEGVLGSGDAARTVFSYLRNYQDTALATARDVLWAATLHAPVAHAVEQRGRDWLVSPGAAPLWSLAPGRTLETAQGQLLAVAAGDGGQLRLAVNAESPCPAGLSRCALAAPGVARVAPIPGWQRLPLRVLGAVGDGGHIYVSGFEAMPEGRAGSYAYWGHAGVNVNVTVVRAGRVALRGRILASTRGATISVPFGPTAKR